MVNTSSVSASSLLNTFSSMTISKRAAPVQLLQSNKVTHHALSCHSFTVTPSYAITLSPCINKMNERDLKT